MKSQDLVLRVADPNGRAFRLRPGEEGISVFVSTSVDPILTGTEVLSAFRAGSVVASRTVGELEAKGLTVVMIAGAAELPERLQAAHAEICPGAGMSRSQFKQALKELE
jgi:hypothetical protein